MGIHYPELRLLRRMSDSERITATNGNYGPIAKSGRMSMGSGANASDIDCCLIEEVSAAPKQSMKKI